MKKAGVVGTQQVSGAVEDEQGGGQVTWVLETTGCSEQLLHLFMEEKTTKQNQGQSSSSDHDLTIESLVGVIFGTPELSVSINYCERLYFLV